MKPRRLLAILFMVTILIGMFSLVAMMAGGAFYGMKTAMGEIGNLASDNSGDPVKAGYNTLSRQVSGLSVSGPIEMVWVRDSKPGFDVTGPAELVAITKYEFKNGNLNLKLNDHDMGKTRELLKMRGETGTVKVTVHSEDPEDLSIAGSGTITAKGLKVSSLDASIAGSGDLTATGTADSIDLSIAGSGDFHAFDLLAMSADVSIAGSGSADVNAAKKLEVAIMGSGDVHYKGNPEIDRSIVGSGDLVRED